MERLEVVDAFSRGVREDSYRALGLARRYPKQSDRPAWNWRTRRIVQAAANAEALYLKGKKHAADLAAKRGEHGNRSR